ncbi:MAG TPA: cytochrome c [Cyclobacteriaceae bacterium]|nr:cytochrome c [Cyclobacteriaceae bacterium]HOO08675.1 cytochrome c [Cyclobacteriaceae bacterium]HPI80381.1 cytochrome c [Cyclobacteriaceae bacterium]
MVSFLAYTSFIYRQPIAQAKDAEAAAVMEGKMVWQNKNCGACHQVYGLGGFLGPDLTNVYSSKGKGPVYIEAFVKAGTPVMPSFQLEEHEMAALLQYLRHVDASGKSDPKQFRINYDGTIANP